MIKDYRIVSGDVESKETDLAKEVKRLIDEGWEPFGSPFIQPETDKYYMMINQAMILRVKDDEPKAEILDDQ